MLLSLLLFSLPSLSSRPRCANRARAGGGGEADLESLYRLLCTGLRDLEGEGEALLRGGGERLSDGDRTRRGGEREGDEYRRRAPPRTRTGEGERACRRGGGEGERDSEGDRARLRGGDGESA